MVTVVSGGVLMHLGRKEVSRKERLEDRYGKGHVHQHYEGKKD